MLTITYPNQMHTNIFKISSMPELQMTLGCIDKLPILEDFPKTKRTIIATIISELGMNILKYAGHGEVRIYSKVSNSESYIDIVAKDHGPGIADVALALQDHFSTGGTLGLGLSGVKRMADRFNINSDQFNGTVIVARKYLKQSSLQKYSETISNTMDGHQPTELKDLNYNVSSFFKPFGHNIKGGDATLAVKHNNGFLLAIIDVLGHGEQASLLASNIVEYISNNLTTNLVNLMHDLHTTFRCSRGAAINLVYIDLKRQSCHSISVGNTNTAIIGNKQWKSLSYNGIVGHRIPSTLAEQTTTFIPGDLILLWTDGLPTRQTLDMVDTIRYKTAEQITHQLITELAKPFDDSGCLVFKWMK